MRCITRHDMKFGQYFIPARTKATVIGTPSSHTVDAPGVQLHLAIDLFDAHLNKKTGVPLSETQINDELEGVKYPHTDSYMTGIVLGSCADQVYMDAGDEFYERTTLSKWKMEKIFVQNIPDAIQKADYSSEYRLDSVLEYLEEEFAEWVRGNCDFCTLTEEDIENGDGLSDSEPGDTILSDLGRQQFDVKRLEYMGRLESIGFTYEFAGGLIWE